MSSSTRFSRKEKELAHDQITFSGVITLGITVLAVGIGILVTLLANDVSILGIISNPSANSQDTALFATFVGYVVMGVVAVIAGFRITNSKYKVDSQEKDTASPLKNGNFMVIIEGEILEDSKVGKIEELATKLVKELQTECATSISRASVLNTSEEKDMLHQNRL